MIRRLWNWHEEPALVERAATPTGRVLLWVAAAVLVRADMRWPVLPLLALALASPGRRFDLLALGSLWVLYTKVPQSAHLAGPVGVGLGMLLSLGLLWLTFRAARRFADLPAAVRRRPLIWTHVTGLAILAGASQATDALGIAPSTPAGAAATTLQVMVPFLLWRACYLALSGKRGSAAESRFRDHLAYWFPVWGGGPTPYGKGLDYLRSQRMDEPMQLSQTRLAGLKLLLLAWLWTGVRSVIVSALYGRAAWPVGNLLHGWSLELTTLVPAIDAGPGAFAFGARWAVLIGDFLRTTLGLAIMGHFLIGVLRLFGFRVFRNTYKPLLATTVVEFWNRYYYYFKELLVEFFFYPTFLATAKRPRRVRMVLAVIAAATCGNLYYHVVRDFPDYFLHGPVALFDRLGGRLVYCVALGLGIAVSMLREQRRRGNPAPLPDGWRQARRLRAMAGVWLFYALLHVWSVGLTRLSLGERVRWMLGLVGL